MIEIDQGGNTSSKLRQKDPLTGEMVDVMWVKGSGGDLGSIKLAICRIVHLI